jgi:hypothetical protein
MKPGSLIKISKNFGPYRALELKRRNIAGCYGLIIDYNSYEDLHSVLIMGTIVNIYPKTWIEIVQ